MDVIATVDSLLSPYVERTVQDAKEKLIEAVRHRYRSQEEVGVVMKFPDRTSLHKAITELTELGVTGLKQFLIGKDVHILLIPECIKMFCFIAGDTSLNIGTNTISFAKSWLHFCHDVMQLVAPDWQSLVESAICEVITAELKHMEKARKKISNSKTLELIDSDLAFVLGNVCKAANHIYKRKMGEDLSGLSSIVEEYTGEPLPEAADLSPTKKPPVPKPRTQIPTPTKKRYTTTAEFV